MALTTIEVPRLDPNTYTGPVRTMSGIARTHDVVTDVPYGEFMRWIYVGTTGNVSYVKWDGTTQVLIGMAAGVAQPFHSIMINSVGTTATNIVVGS